MIIKFLCRPIKRQFSIYFENGETRLRGEFHSCACISISMNGGGESMWHHGFRIQIFTSESAHVVKKQVQGVVKALFHIDIFKEWRKGFRHEFDNLSAHPDSFGKDGFPDSRRWWQGTGNGSDALGE